MKKHLKHLDYIKRNCKTYFEVEQYLNNLDKNTKGEIFEMINKNFFKYIPYWNKGLKVKNVWRLKDLPDYLFTQLNIPKQDLGFDGMIETQDNEFIPYQTKFRSNNTIAKSELDSFTTFLGSYKIFKKGIIFANIDKIPRENQFFKGVDAYEIKWILRNDIEKAIDETFIKNIGVDDIKIKEIKKKFPWEFQQEIINTPKEHKQIINLACGLGKTLLMFFLAEDELKRRNVINVVMAVPSLYLVKQNLNEFIEQAIAYNIKLNFLSVCSDSTVADNGLSDPERTSEKEGEDEGEENTSISEIPQNTNNVEEIVKFIDFSFNTKFTEKTINLLITTYQSGDLVISAEEKITFDHIWDFKDLDEAHKTVGRENKAFAALVKTTKIKYRWQYALTATEKFYEERLHSREGVISMDDIQYYGRCVYKMTFKEAIEKGYLTDYQIIVQLCTRKDIASIINQNTWLQLTDDEFDGVEQRTRTIAALIALEDHINENIEYSNVISSHRKRDYGRRFQRMAKMLIPEIETYFLSGEDNSNYKQKILKEFVSKEISLVSHAGCLSEGVNEPKSNGWLPVDPIQSKITTVQSMGRIMRKDDKNNKKLATVILPIVVDLDENDQPIWTNEAYEDMFNFISALGEQDERVQAFFSNLPEDRRQNHTSIVKFKGKKNINISSISIREMKQALSLMTIKKESYIKDYNEAKKLVRDFNIHSREEYEQMVINKTLPNGLPQYPNMFYGNDWKGWDDYMGKESPDPDKIYQFIIDNNLLDPLVFQKFKSENLPQGFPKNIKIFIKNYKK